MVKKCIYCSTEIDSGSVVDMCQRCMYQVWGEKMSKAIIEGMEKEKEAGNLELGQVGERAPHSIKEIKPVVGNDVVAAVIEEESLIQSPDMEVREISSEKMIF